MGNNSEALRNQEGDADRWELIDLLALLSDVTVRVHVRMLTELGDGVPLSDVRRAAGGTLSRQVALVADEHT